MKERVRGLPPACEGDHARWVFAETVDALGHARSLEHLAVLMRAHHPHVLRLPSPHVEQVRRAVSATKARLMTTRDNGDRR